MIKYKENERQFSQINNQQQETNRNNKQRTSKQQEVNKGAQKSRVVNTQQINTTRTKSMDMNMNLNYVNSYDANSPYTNNFGKNSLIMAANLDDLDVSPDTTISSGKWGPISWDIDEDTSLEEFNIEVYFLGVNVIDAVLNVENPSIFVSVNIFGVDLKLEVGISNSCIYARGKIYYIFGSKAFDDNIFCF